MRRIPALLAREFRAALPPTLFFLVAFHVAALTRSLMMETYGITPAGSALATISALVMGKVILILNKFHFPNRFASRPLIVGILWKTLLFGLFGSLFLAAEEWLPLLLRYGSARTASRHLLAEVVWPRFLANHIVLMLWVLVYCIVIELIRVLGAARVKALFLGPPTAASRRRPAKDAR